MVLCRSTRLACWLWCLEVVFIHSVCGSSCSDFGWNKEVNKEVVEIDGSTTRALNDTDDTTARKLLYDDLHNRLTQCNTFAFDVSIKGLVSMSASFFIGIPCVERIVSLNLSSNGLDSLDVGTLLPLRCLKTLRVSKNKLSRLLPGTLPQGLEVLDVSYNQLTILENGTFDQMQYLRAVNLSHNNLHTVQPGAFNEGMMSVLVADLSYNHLEVFEPWPYYFDRSVSVNLTHNKISRFMNSVDIVLVREMYLAEINLMYNNISRLTVYDLAQYFAGQKPTATQLSLMNLVVSNNPWVCDCDLFFVVNLLLNSFLRDLQEVKKLLTCSSPPELRGKDMEFLFSRQDLLVCNITDNCPTGCTCQDRPFDGYVLVNCDPSKHLYTQLPTVVPSSLNPLYLNLSGHGLRDLDTQVDYASRLYGLDVSCNKLINLPASFLESAKNLSELNISKNELASFPAEVRSLLSLRLLRLTSNPFVCSCDFLWFGYWVSSITVNSSASLLNQSTSSNLISNSDQQSRTGSTKPHEFISDFDQATCVMEDGSVILVSKMALSLNCSSLQIGLLVCGICILLVVLGLTGVGWRWRYEVRVILFYQFGHLCPNLRCFLKIPETIDDTVKIDDINVEEGVNQRVKLHDVYISVDENDQEMTTWVRDVLLPELEKRKRPLRVYLPLRQDIPGGCKAEDRVDAILSSANTLALVSRAYAQNAWCREEFDHACRHLEEENAGKLILLKMTRDDDTRDQNDDTGDDTRDLESIDPIVQTRTHHKPDLAAHRGLCTSSTVCCRRRYSGLEMCRSVQICWKLNVLCSAWFSRCWWRQAKARREGRRRRAVRSLSLFREGANHSLVTLEPLNTFLMEKQYLSSSDRFWKEKLIFEISTRKEKHSVKEDSGQPH